MTHYMRNYALPLWQSLTSSWDSHWYLSNMNTVPGCSVIIFFPLFNQLISANPLVLHIYLYFDFDSLDHFQPHYCMCFIINAPEKWADSER